MSFLDCINNGEKEGKLTKEQAEKARAMFNEFEASNARTMPPDEAANRASADTFDALDAEAKERKRRVILQHNAQRKALADVRSYKGDRVSRGFSYLLERSEEGIAPFRTARGLQNSYRAFAHAKIDNVFAELKKTAVLGRTTLGQKAKAKEMVRAAWKQSDDALANDMFKAWSEAAEFLRKAFNRAGGNIPKRADWGFPQIHDAESIRNVGLDEWSSFIKDRLDWEKITSERTGSKFTEAEIPGLLEEIYETIITDGFLKVKETSIAGQGRSLARRRTDHRFLVFKSADDWTAYNEKFGGGDLFSTMMNHIDTMARDIALLERLGPNPNSTIRFLKTQLEREARIADKDIKGRKRPNVDGLNADFKKFDDMYGVITGSSYAPVNKTVARYQSGLAEMLSAAQLGAASILAIFGDAGTARVQARLLGMPHVSLVPKMLTSMKMAKADKMNYIRSGLMAENWSAVAYGQSRYIGELLGPQLTQRISDFAMKISLLSPATQAHRWTFGGELMGFVADNLNKSFDELPDGLSRAFRKYGINSDDWDVLKSVGPNTFKGATFMRPDDVLDKDRIVAFKYLDFIQGEVNLAVPVSLIRGETALTGGTRPGSFAGSLLRSVAQYKNFPMTFYLNNLRQITNIDGSIREKALYATDLMVTSISMAAIAIQTKEVLKGRDPVPMFDEDGTPNTAFWGSAILSSGGLGIFGDFLFANLNRHDRGLAETVAGTQVSFLNDVINLTVGNIVEVATGQETKAAKEGVEFLARYSPGASTWYLRLAMERLILDNMRRLADPKAPQRFRRMQRTRLKDYGQQYWWKPGQMAPERAPDLGAMVGRLPD